MPKYKYKIGQTVFPRDCTPAYQRKNPIKIKFRRKNRGEHSLVLHNIYSTNGTGWYPESTLIRGVESDLQKNRSDPA